jgi:ketohexokinase
MAKILAVGIATLDIINVVDTYPAENSEVRALSQQKVRGGNATNSLVVLSQLGHQCHWAGISINESDSVVIEQELKRYAISTSACRVLDHGKMPTSYITLNKQTGSRSIVHYRDCPEYSFEDFRKINPSDYVWIHFEGRNIDQTRLMLNYLAEHFPQIPRSLEVEKPRPDIESLFDSANLLLFSKDYAQNHGFDDAQSFLTAMSPQIPVAASCTWGEQGAWLISNKTSLLHHQAPPHKAIVDTLAAGDTFNAAMIHSLLAQDSYDQALKFATTLASHKCQQQGLHDLLTHFDPPIQL